MTHDQDNQSVENKMKPKVSVTLVNAEGEKIVTFPATREGSFSEDAEKVGYEIPTSCRAGACFVCAGRVKSGAECIDIGKLSVPLIDIDEDQVLMCIGGVKESCFLDGEEYEIIIEKE